MADDDDKMAMAEVFLLEDERPGGDEGGEEEAPPPSLPLRRPSFVTPRCAPLPGGAGGGSSGSDHHRVVAEEGTADAAGARLAWIARLSFVVVVQGGGEGRRGGRGRGWIDVIEHIGVG
jgi:hypothetical protein